MRLARALGFYSAVVTAGSVVALIFFATTLFDAYGNAVAIGLSAVALVLSIVAGMLFFFYAVPFNPTFPISTLQGVPYSATELLDVAE